MTSNHGSDGRAVGLVGANGRLGCLVAAELNRLCVIWQPLFISGDSASDLLQRFNVVIDVSESETLPKYASQMRSGGPGLLTCVSGYSRRELDILQAIGSRVPVVHCRNANPGYATIRSFIRAAIQTDGSPNHVAIAERHPVTKRDAPSATALQLWRDAVALVGDEGRVHIEVVRGGDPVSDHSVRLDYGSYVLESSLEVKDLTASARRIVTLALSLPRKAGLYIESDGL